MKITYKFANSENVDVEVSEEWANIILELDHKEFNVNRKETRRHTPLEEYDKFGNLLSSEDDVVGEVMTGFENERLYAAIKKLSPRYRHLIEEVYFKGRTYSDIALEEGVYCSTISRTVERALKKLEKFLK